MSADRKAEREDISSQVAKLERYGVEDWVNEVRQWSPEDRRVFIVSLEASMTYIEEELFHFRGEVGERDVDDTERDNVKNLILVGLSVNGATRHRVLHALKKVEEREVG